MEAGVAAFLDHEPFHHGVVEQLIQGVGGNNHLIVGHSPVVHPVSVIDHLAATIELGSFSAAKTEAKHALVALGFGDDISKEACAVAHSIFLVTEALVAQHVVRVVEAAPATGIVVDHFALPALAVFGEVNDTVVRILQGNAHRSFVLGENPHLEQLLYSPIPDNHDLGSVADGFLDADENVGLARNHLDSRVVDHSIVLVVRNRRDIEEAHTLQEICRKRRQLMVDGV